MLISKNSHTNVLVLVEIATLATLLLRLPVMTHGPPFLIFHREKALAYHALGESASLSRSVSLSHPPTPAKHASGYSDTIE